MSQPLHMPSTPSPDSQRDQKIRRIAAHRSHRDRLEYYGLNVDLDVRVAEALDQFTSLLDPGGRVASMRDEVVEAALREYLALDQPESLISIVGKVTTNPDELYR